MRNQQAQEREEQQRIKNLVLNLDLRESDDQDSESNQSSKYSFTLFLTIHSLQAMNLNLWSIITTTKLRSLPAVRLSVAGSFNSKILSGMRILQLSLATFLAEASVDDCQRDCSTQLAGKANSVRTLTPVKRQLRTSFQHRVRMIGLTIDLVGTRSLEIPYKAACPGSCVLRIL